MFEQTFKNIDDVLHKDAGCGSELDYVEQSSWVLFLKYLDDLEKDRESSATLAGKAYEPILRDEYRWGVWAMPRTATGEIDHHAALTGDDLIECVNGEASFNKSLKLADSTKVKPTLMQSQKCSATKYSRRTNDPEQCRSKHGSDSALNHISCWISLPGLSVCRCWSVE